MKRIIFVLLCLFVLVPSDVFGARIKIQTKLVMPDFDFYIDSVIVLQEEQKVIGHMWEHKKLRPFRLKEKRIDLALQNLLRKSFPEQEGKRRLIVKFNRIIYNIFDNNSAFGANITFIENIDGRHFELASFKFIETREVKLHSFTAKSRGFDLANYVYALLEEFLVHEKNTDKEELMAHDELKHLARFEVNEENFPVLANKQPAQKGVIKTFDDFAQGNIAPYPDLKLDTIVYRKTKHHRVTVENDNFELDSVWGVYDGEQYYIREGRFFRPFIIADNRIFIHAPSASSGEIDKIPIASMLLLTPLISSALFPDGLPLIQTFLIGALIGGAIYGITERIVSISKKYVYYELDLLTGLFNQVTKKEFKKHKNP